MHSIQKKDWYKLNEIIEIIYTKPSKTLFFDILNHMDTLFTFDYSLCQYFDFWGTPSQKPKLFSENIPPKYIELYEQQYQSTDFTDWILASNEPITLRISDLLPKAILENSALYKNWMALMNIQYGAVSAFTAKGSYQGSIFLYRDASKANFTKKEMEILSVINRHLCNRINIELGFNNANLIQNDIERFLTRFKFTSKEKELLFLISTGEKRSELARKLYITNNTLKKHFANIYGKLDIGTYEELITLMHSCNW